MSRELTIAKGLTLPIDAATQKLAFMGRTGSGKTYAASKVAEEMLDAGVQVIILDPVGVWWGLRLAANGRDPGIAIPVFGGLHGDIPLEPTGGAVVANAIVDKKISAVIDVSQMISSEQMRFATAFATQFYERQKAAPSAVFVFLEECQEFIPQQPQQGEQHMLHAFQRMCKIGRNFGIGVGLISQRPQEIAKKVLNMTECFFAFQMTGPQERKAIKDYVSEKGGDLDIVAELPKFAVGECHVWSPQWLQVSRTVKILQKRTYDASSTPKVGAKTVEARALAPVDLESLRTQMAETIERAKLEDPAELRKQLAERDRKIRQLESAKPAAVADQAAIAREVQRAVQATTRTNAQSLSSLRKALEAAMKFIINVSTQKFDVAGVDKEELERAISAAVLKATDIVERRLVSREAQIENLRLQAQRIASQLKAALGEEETVISVEVAKNEPFTVSTPPSREPRAQPARAARSAAAPTTEGVTPSMQRILNALASFEQLGIRPAKRVNVAFFAGYTENGHFNNMCGTLRTAGLLDYPNGGMLELTDAGRAVADSAAHPIESLQQLHDAWMSKISPSEAKLLAVILSCAPSEISREVLAARTGYTENGHFNNMLGHLRSLGAIDYPRGAHVVATDVLFPEGLN